ncbi:MAG: pentapeptide repeat-containing protein [Rhizonema sp. NSF051]|nr:pentapeptide repeat-containing protein [Rhizonema sp. NSF051]
MEGSSSSSSGMFPNCEHGKSFDVIVALRSGKHDIQCVSDLKYKHRPMEAMPPDYFGQNLRGRSFRGQNLEGVNFIGADIRSADFSNAILKNANFSHARAGLQKRWATVLVVVSWVLMGLSGFLSALAGFLTAWLVFYSDKDEQVAYHIAGWTLIVLLVIFFFVTIRQGVQAVLGVIAVAVAGAVTGAGVVAVAIAFAGAIAVAGAVGCKPHRVITILRIKEIQR